MAWNCIGVIMRGTIAGIGAKATVLDCMGRGYRYANDVLQDPYCLVWQWVS